MDRTTLGAPHTLSLYSFSMAEPSNGQPSGLSEGEVSRRQAGEGSH